MTPRILAGLCALAILGGGVTAGLMSANPSTAGASAPQEEYAEECCEGQITADIICWVTIQHAHVEGSNICTQHSGAHSGDDVTDGGHDHGTPPADHTHPGGGNASHAHGEHTECYADGLVTVQACDVVEDSLNENDILSHNEIIKDVLNENDVDIVEDVIEKGNDVDVTLVEDVVEDNSVVTNVVATVQSVIG